MMAKKDEIEETIEVETEETEPEEELSPLELELKEAKERCDGYLAQLKRVQADFENYQKRMELEKERIVAMANETFICEFLDTLDNFERALESLDKLPEEDSEGIMMVYDGLRKLLEDSGLEKIEAMNCQFDPHKHEAVMQLETGEVEDGTVLEEFQKGYIFRSKVVRPSKVKVSKRVNEIQDKEV